MTNTELNDTLLSKRADLAGVLHPPLIQAASCIGQAWGDSSLLDDALEASLALVPYANRGIVLDGTATQVSATIYQDRRAEGGNPSLAEAPFMREVMPPWGFLLSDAFYDAEEGKLSLAAVHRIYQHENVVGYVVMLLDLKDLPPVEGFSCSIENWRQIKGDPAIRGGLFQQQRADSIIDRNLEKTTNVLADLMVERGLFQAVIHFSGSRATGWFVADPFRYQFLGSDVLTHPHGVLAFPATDYPAEAKIPKEAVRPILERMAKLRMADDVIYLRAASINLFNGIVSLTFSCDGTHYLPYQEFLNEASRFWASAA